MLRLLDRFLGLTEKVFFVSANTALIVILIINIANVGSRYFWQRGLIWVFPWTTVLFVWMVFFGFYVIYRRNRDIKVDIVYQMFPPRLQNAVTIVTNLVIVGLMAVILWQATILLPRQVGNMDYVGLQRYWLAIPFYAACALILLDFLRDTIERLISPRTGGGDVVPASTSGSIR